MVAVSTIPAAINALVAILDAAITDADVFDGESLSGSTADYICIGFDPYDMQHAVEGDQVPASLGNRAREESYEILCSLGAMTGGTSMSQRRARAMSLFGLIESTLRANVTLNGAVRSAQVGTYSLVQTQTEDGALVGLRFRIACSARLT